MDQIEFYFSDENLEKDAFLLKHVRRNKLGYVSVKLLTSFKKVRLEAHTLLQGPPGVLDLWPNVLINSLEPDDYQLLYSESCKREK